MYKLGYINGYNKLNTPHFSNIVNQNQFFDNNVSYTIDAYYPPYYTNVIKLTSSDISFNVKLNFLYIIHNNKRYYYFIKDIKYINEDVFEITIEMDVIQTFAFNIDINTANLIRESIKRWDANNNINREYIPENISKGIDEVVDFTEQSLSGQNEQLDYYVCWCSKDFANAGFTNVFCSILNEDGSYNNTGLYCYLIPCFRNRSYMNANYTYDIYLGDSATPIASYTYLDLIGAISVLQVLDAAYTISIYRTNSSILSQAITFSYSIDAQTNKVSMRFVGAVIDAHFKYSNAVNNYFALCLYQFENYTRFFKSYEIKVNNNSFQKNTAINNLFNLKYCPQMIDENYMNFTFGEKIFGSAPPLRKFDYMNVDLRFSYDITTGSRCYLAKRGVGDKYNSTVQLTVPLSLRIVNTAWSEYMAYHQGTMTTGVALQYTNASFNYFKNIAGSFRSESKSAISAGLIQSTVGFVQENYNIGKKLQILKENLYNSPATVGQGSNFFADDASKANKVFVSLSIVKDIEECARKFEHYGYAVNKFNVYNCSVMDLPKNRYHWNVYQMIDCDLAINSSSPCLIGEDLLNKFAKRLEDGIRLIHLDSLTQDDLLSNIIYDNIEVDYIQ